MSTLENSYLAKVIVTFIGSGAMFAAIAGGYYTIYLTVTALGN